MIDLSTSVAPQANSNPLQAPLSTGVLSPSPTAADFHTPLQTPSGLVQPQQAALEHPKKKSKKKKKKSAGAKTQQAEPFREQYNEIAALKESQPLSNQKRDGDSAGNAENISQGSHSSKVIASFSRLFSNAVQT